MFRHEGRHRAWLAKYKYGYQRQRILVTVGVEWTMAEPWKFKDDDRALRQGDTIQHSRTTTIPDLHLATAVYAHQVCDIAALSPEEDPPLGSAYVVWKEY